MANFFEKILKTKTGGSGAQTADSQKGGQEEKKASEKIESTMEVDKSIVVYTMPERYRPSGNSPKSKKLGFLILIGGFFALAILAAVGWYYLKEKDRGAGVSTAPTYEEKQILPDESENRETIAQDDREIKDSLATYLDFKREEESAKNIESFDLVISRYGSAKFMADWESLKTRASGLKNEDYETFAGLLSCFSPSTAELNIGLVKSENSGLAALAAEISGRPIRVELVKSDENWKIDSESGFLYTEAATGEKVSLENWIDEKLAGYSGGENFASGADTDSDGLTDAEEAALGTDINSGDTDGDGYGDLSEVMNLYNPAGAGKIDDNAGLKKYENKSFSYSLFYPAGWRITTVGGDDSVMISSADGEFFQIVIQPDADKKTIDDWYKEQFDIREISSGQIFEAKDGGSVVWRGIMTTDGLTVYFTDNSREHIFALSYSPANKTVMNYPNLFRLAAASFRFE